MKRTLMIILVLVLALSTGAIAVNAQGPGDGPGAPGNPPRGDRGPNFEPVVLDIVASATGLERDAILQMLREDDMTLAEIIEANGGDVAAVSAELTTALTAQINERAAERVENVDEMVDHLLNETPRFGRDGRGGRHGDRPGGGLIRIAVETIASEASIDADVIREGLEAGQTLSEIAAAQGLDANIIGVLVGQVATEGINEAVAEGKLTQEQADQLLANMEANINRVMNTTAQEVRQNAAVRGAVIKATVDTLDLGRGDLRDQIAAGQTLADFITAQGGDVEAVVSAAVANLQDHVDHAVEDGKLTTEEAAELMAGAEAAVRSALAEPHSPQLPGR